jgi:hypothetical protein
VKKKKEESVAEHGQHGTSVAAQLAAKPAAHSTSHRRSLNSEKKDIYIPWIVLCVKSVFIEERPCSSPKSRRLLAAKP